MQAIPKHDLHGQLYHTICKTVSNAKMIYCLVFIGQFACQLCCITPQDAT